MLNTIRRRLTREEGVSLVETLVGMVILGIVLAGLMSTMITAFAAVHSQEHRLRAQQLGNEVIEELRALPWSGVGIASSSPGFELQPEFDGQTWLTVELDPAVAEVEAERVETRDGMDYTIATDVVWADDDSGPTTIVRAHKRFRVLVSWEIRGVERMVRTDGLRARTASQASPEAFTVTLNITPAEFDIDADGDTTQPALIATAVTSHNAVLSPRVFYEPVVGSPTFVNMIPVAGAKLWVAAIPVSTHTWDPPGSRVFRVVATRSSDGIEAFDQFTVKVLRPFTATLDAVPDVMPLLGDDTNALPILFEATTSIPAIQVHLYLETAAGEVGPFPMDPVFLDPNHPVWHYTVGVGGVHQDGVVTWEAGIRTMRVETRWSENPAEDTAEATTTIEFLPFVPELPPLPPLPPL